MNFGLISHKIETLSEHYSTTKLHAIQRQITPLLKSHPMPPSLLELCVIEGVFLLETHKKWCHLPLFQDLAKEFLSANFQLQPATAEQVLVTIQSCTMPHPNPAGTGDLPTERDFLTWLIATSTLATSSLTLLCSTGFGVDLIQRLKRAAKAAFQSADSGDKTFLNHLDQALLEVTVQLSLAQKKEPWHLEGVLLTYTLGQLPEPWQSLSREASENFVHNVLAYLAGHPETSSAEICRKLKDEIDGLDEIPQLARHVLALLQHLEKKKLIYAINNPKNKIALTTQWLLATLGERLSARLYLAQWETNPSLEDILKMGEYTQLAYLETVDRRDLVQLQLFLGSLHRFKPRVVPQIVALAKQDVSPQGLRQAICQAIETSRIPWLKRTLLECLEPFRDDESIRSFAREIAQCDPAPLVKEAAESLLEHRPPVRQFSPEVAQSPSAPTVAAEGNGPHGPRC